MPLKSPQLKATGLPTVRYSSLTRLGHEPINVAELAELCMKFYIEASGSCMAPDGMSRVFGVEGRKTVMEIILDFYIVIFSYFCTIAI